MRLIGFLFFKTTFLLFSVLFCAPRLEAAELREIRVTVAASNAFKEAKNWEKDVRDRIVFANRIFEKQFGIFFRVQGYASWNPLDEKREMSLLLEELRSTIPLEANHVVIGFHRMSEAYERDALLDMETVGSAQFFRGYVIIRDPFEELPENYRHLVMTHELAHLFGSVHVADADQIMNASASGKVQLTLDPANTEIIRATREVDFQRGLESLPADAIESLTRIYERLIHSHPHSDFYHQLGIFYRMQQQESRAVSTWEKAVRYHYDNPLIHRELGYHYFRNGRYNKAIQEIGSAIAHFVLPSQQKQKAEALNTIGVAYYQKGNKQQAMIHWLKGLTADPESPDLQGNLAAYYLEQGDLERGIAELEKLAAKYPEDSTTWGNLGVASLQNKRFVKAKEYFERALKTLSKTQETKGKQNQLMQDIPEAQLRLNLAAALIELSQDDAALGQLERAQRLNPKDYRIQNYLARIYLKKGSYNQALEEGLRALRFKKDDPYLYSYVAQAYDGLGQYMKAIDAARLGIPHAEGKMKSALYRNVGLLFAKQGNLPEAMIELKNALNYDWNDAGTHTQLAYVYAQKRDYDEAKRSFQTALRIDPSNIEAQKGLEKLKNFQKSQ